MDRIDNDNKQFFAKMNDEYERPPLFAYFCGGIGGVCLIIGLKPDLLTKLHFRASEGRPRVETFSPKISASNNVQLKKCTNCGRAIGRLEKTCLFEDQAVCVECYQRLEKQGQIQ